MKFAVYGAGAIGAFLGARLAEAGHEVVLIARGAHLQALRESGLRVQSDLFGERLYRLTAVEHPAEAGTADYLILGVKAQALTQIAPSAEALLRPSSTIVSTQNGLPWWYFHGVEDQEPVLESVDPGGVVARHLPPRQTVGSIVYISSRLESPGVVRHTEGARLPLGEPDGSASDRIRALSQAFRDGGLKAPIRNDIRHELWVKLLGNGIFNPLSALTRKTMIEMIEHPAAHELILTAMREIRDTAAALGVQLAFSPEKRLEGARSAGFHKTSMLQDLEAGRPPELAPITGAIVELAARKHVAAPALGAIHAAASLLFAPPRMPPE
jgi:2-dehydropantoate 2-reductase